MTTEMTVKSSSETVLGPPAVKDVLLEAGTAEPDGYDHVESYVDLENQTVEVSVRDRRTGAVYAYALKLVVGPVRSL